jgi:para-nitrobenzyl esterase
MQKKWVSLIIMIKTNFVFEMALQRLSVLAIGACCIFFLAACSPEKYKKTGDESKSISAEVSITGGLIRGLISDNKTNSLKQYHGIPFAAPPLGKLRWAPPAPVIPWAGTLDATSHGRYCMQSETTGIGIYIGKRSNPSEDCLTINVWTRANRVDEKRPVMFWIHGGGLLGGAGFEQSGEALTKKGVVLVTFNYRLGRLGFFSHPELSAENPKGVSGNQGFRDQIAALHWVQENITKFGGDPNNVTIFGESAGSFSVSALQASPLAKGLFHRAIGQSGGIFWPMSHRSIDRPWAPSDEKLGMMLAEALVGEALVGEGGNASLDLLRATPADQVIAAAESSPALSALEYIPTVDGEVLPDEISSIFSRGEQADVPTMIGNNANEHLAVMGLFTCINGSGVDGFNRFKTGLLGEVFDEIGPLYPSDTEQAILQSWEEFSNDVNFTYPMRLWARAMSNVSSDVYLYWFNYHPPVLDRQYKAFHGGDLPYVFGQLDMFGGNPVDADFVDADTMMSIWTRFAASGNPNGKNVDGWEAFTPSNERYYILGPENTPAGKLRVERMDLIEKAWDIRRVQGTVSLPTVMPNGIKDLMRKCKGANP